MGIFDNKRPKSAINRDRKYFNASEKHEVDYAKRTKRRKNKYSKFSDGGDISNTFDDILINHGFVKKRGAYGVRMYYNKQKDVYASIDDLTRTVEVFKDDDLVVQGRDYSGYSIVGLAEYLKQNGFKETPVKIGYTDDEIIELIKNKLGEEYDDDEDYFQRAEQLGLKWNKIRKMWMGDFKFADGGGVEEDEFIDKIKSIYGDINITPMYSDKSRYQIITPYFNTLFEINRKYFKGAGILEKYGNLSSTYVLYSPVVNKKNISFDDIITNIPLGAKVKIVENLGDHKGYKGQELEVVSADDDNFYHVQDLSGKTWYAGEEELEVINKFAKGGRLKSALMRDRAYKSQEPHEQNYKRKSRPKNPKYRKDDGWFADGGGVENAIIIHDEINANGEIHIDILTGILGRKPNYPNEVIDGLKFEKCLYRPYYRLV